MTEKSLDEMFFETKLGKYDVVRNAIELIKVKKDEEGYAHLPQTLLLNKVLREVLENNMTYEQIEKLRQEKKAKKAKQQEDANATAAAEPASK
ncbi:hypothetical protein [Candidatus Ruminimicrobium bovinum]|uniref:hypothetical protein n=1 Tax=Candidatus Ruminimicrobium bovinum TaxID=3242779 RepID=UPI0039B93666